MPAGILVNGISVAVKAASPTSPGAMGFDEWLSHDNFFRAESHVFSQRRAASKIRGGKFGNM